MGEMPITYQGLIKFLFKIGVLKRVGLDGYSTWQERDANGKRTGKMLEKRYCTYPVEDDDDW